MKASCSYKCVTRIYSLLKTKLYSECSLYGLEFPHPSKKFSFPLHNSKLSLEILTSLKNFHHKEIVGSFDFLKKISGLKIK